MKLQDGTSFCQQHSKFHSAFYSYTHKQFNRGAWRTCSSLSRRGRCNTGSWVSTMARLRSCSAPEGSAVQAIKGGRMEGGIRGVGRDKRNILKSTTTCGTQQRQTVMHVRLQLSLKLRLEMAKGSQN